MPLLFLNKLFTNGLTLLAMLFMLTAQGQPSNDIDRDISVKKMQARAENAARSGDVYTALFYYLEVVNAHPKDLEARYQLAEMHRLSRNYPAAESAYGFLLDSAKGNYPFALFYKAQMQKMSGKYEDAKQNLLLFRKQNKNLGDKDFKKMLSQEIAGCDSGMVYREFPENVNITNAGKSVNKPHTEFSPFLLDSNTMLFGSLRMDSLKFYNVREEYKEVQPLRQVYKAEKTNGSWNNTGKYHPFNDSTMEMGNFVYAPNSGKYFFTKCTKNNDGKVLCKIYVTEKTISGWSEPKVLPEPINTEGYTSTQPAIVIDTTGSVSASSAEMKPKAAGNTAKQSRKPVPRKKAIQVDGKSPGIEYLYFVSDRPEGKGELDIWYSTYNSKKNEWAAPVNASTMNTPEMECTPFFHIPSQTFYFSSDGQASAGGLDIYKTWKVDKRYIRPQNVSFPINSPQDELGFVLGDDGKKGFFVSNRPGGTPFFHETCCDDIFEFEILPVPLFNCTLELEITDADTSGCRDQIIKMLAYNMKTKESGLEEVLVKDCKFIFPLKQKYQYKFFTEKAGYVKDTLFLETRDMASASKVKKKLVLLPEAKVKTTEVIQEKPIEGIPFVLIDIQYETDQTSLNDDARAAVDTLLVPFLLSHPKDLVVVNSHTDDHGSHKYNMTLSQARAANVVKYLVSKGVEKSRLEGKGFGETKPIAPNKDAEGNDNPIGRSMNRRTEFLITKP